MSSTIEAVQAVIDEWAGPYPSGKGMTSDDTLDRIRRIVDGRTDERLRLLGHDPQPDGRCRHRWNNRLTRDVDCEFLAGWRAAPSLKEGGS